MSIPLTIIIHWNILGVKTYCINFAYSYRKRKWSSAPTMKLFMYFQTAVQNRAKHYEPNKQKRLVEVTDACIENVRGYQRRPRGEDK